MNKRDASFSDHELRESHESPATPEASLRSFGLFELFDVWLVRCWRRWKFKALVSDEGSEALHFSSSSYVPLLISART